VVHHRKGELWPSHTSVRLAKSFERLIRTRWFTITSSAISVFPLEVVALTTSLIRTRVLVSLIKERVEKGATVLIGTHNPYFASLIRTRAFSKSVSVTQFKSRQPSLPPVLLSCSHKPYPDTPVFVVVVVVAILFALWSFVPFIGFLLDLFTMMYLIMVFAFCFLKLAHTTLAQALSGHG